jgi:hypothetical protein
MGEVSIIGLDLAKNVFQVHGADASGAILFRKRVRRAQVLEFFAAQPSCTVAMEACAGAHYWGREIGKLGHTVRLIAPAGSVTGIGSARSGCRAVDDLRGCRCHMPLFHRVGAEDTQGPARNQMALEIEDVICISHDLI